MNAVAKSTEVQSPETRKRGPKHFGRTYDHAKGVLKIDVAGRDGAGFSLSLADVPETLRNAFALQAMADFIVGNGNEITREGGTLEDAIKALNTAADDVLSGKVEFREGIGLGMSSAPATLLVGRALVEEGKNFVRWNGKQYDFSGDVVAAQEAMRVLYFDTNEVTLPNGSKMTGRQFFRQISEVPSVADRVASYKKAKPASAAVAELVG